MISGILILTGGMMLVSLKVLKPDEGRRDVTIITGLIGMMMLVIG